MKPFISVIMAVYNNEKLLPAAVNSVLNQTYENFELIIVDDGSTDNTPKVADEFAKKDKRVKVIHQENQWIYASFNNGIAEAQGEYIIIVNSDDTINPDSLLEIKKEADRNNPDIIFYNLEIFYCDENQNILARDLYGKKNLIKENFCVSGTNNVRAQWSTFLKRRLLSAQCVYKSTIAKSNSYRNDIYMADQFFNLQIADQVSTVSGISYVVYNHFQYSNESNASVGKFYGYEHEKFNEYYCLYKDLFEKWQLPEEDFNVLKSVRLANLTMELKKYNLKACPLSKEEAINKIFYDSIDDVIYECGIASGRKEELEARILSALREFFITFIPDESSEARVVYDMLDSLLRYEKDESDIEKIKKCVYNEKNKYNIGEEFLKKLGV